jgi:hypothetical protein
LKSTVLALSPQDRIGVPPGVFALRLLVPARAEIVGFRLGQLLFGFEINRWGTPLM